MILSVCVGQGPARASRKVIWWTPLSLCAQVEFILVERKLPPIESLTLRVDSSLGEGLSLPDEAAKVSNYPFPSRLIANAFWRHLCA